MNDRTPNFIFILAGIVSLGFLLLCVLGFSFLLINTPSWEFNDTTLIQNSGNLKYVFNKRNFKDIDESNFYLNLKTLEIELIPENDPLELAIRLGGGVQKPVQKKEMPPKIENGFIRNFWVLNLDTNKYRQTEAVLAYQTPHLYFWIESGIDFDHDSLVRLAETFENHIYPLNRSFFGDEPSPGVDNDIHLGILFTKGLGGAAGYFYTTDSYEKQIKPFSNEAEMIYLSADYINLGDEYAYGVLAHEFQHMIHWHTDRNESIWVSEGLSELAVDLNGYPLGGFYNLFALQPDIQLTFWPGPNQDYLSPHYGASYLFMRYLYDRFGLSFIQSLVSDQENGLLSIDQILEDLKDQFNGDGINHPANLVFQDWTIANILQNKEISKGEYGYDPETTLPKFQLTELHTCDSERNSGEVSQYGTDYIEINCGSPFHVVIKGNENVSLLPVEPHSGKYYFWSNFGDESDMRLYRTFDFSEINRPVQLSYWAWYDLEKDYDYLYVLASVDGKKWEILEPTSCDHQNSTGSNYGCGYNGISGGWKNESVDLSRFVGNEVTIQFEYITDTAVNGDGFLLDDVAIYAINYYEDFETDTGGWINEGFVRIENALPQRFAVSLINLNDFSSIKKFITDSSIEISVAEPITNSDDRFILIISGLTRFTHQPAEYEYWINTID